MCLFLASQYGFCTGSQIFAGFPIWVVKLLKRLAIAAVHRADQELHLCSHGHLRNSKEEFEPEGRLVSFAPRLLNLLSKELIDIRCTYLPFCFSWSILFFSNRIFPVISPGRCPSTVYAPGQHSLWNREALEVYYPLFNPFFLLICISPSAIMEAVFF